MDSEAANLEPPKTKEFLLVEYDDGFNIAHTSWLRMEENQLFCKWPGLYQEDHEKAVKKGKLDETWGERMVISIIAEFDTFKAAREKFKAAEKGTDVDTDVEGKTRKRKPNSRYEQSDDEDNVRDTCKNFNKQKKKIEIEDDSEKLVPPPPPPSALFKQPPKTGTLDSFLSKSGSSGHVDALPRKRKSSPGSDTKSAGKVVKPSSGANKSSSSGGNKSLSSGAKSSSSGSEDDHEPLSGANKSYRKPSCIKEPQEESESSEVLKHGPSPIVPNKSGAEKSVTEDASNELLSDSESGFREPSHLDPDDTWDGAKSSVNDNFIGPAKVAEALDQDGAATPYPFKVNPLIFVHEDEFRKFIVRELMLIRMSILRLKLHGGGSSTLGTSPGAALDCDALSCDDDDFITTVEQLENWNNRLIRDKEYFKKKALSLSLVGGKTANKVVSGILTSTISCHVGVKYSFLGAKRKLKFQDLKGVCSVIKCALHATKVGRDAPYASISKDEIQASIMEWLRQQIAKSKRSAPARKDDDRDGSSDSERKLSDDCNKDESA